ncbi:hypothetical protein GCM10010112_59670 [Actinoplanes lobatus]|uniref:Uncharacterized protein n=1 Tax=Actinoplanes lobatus TaxID=113568 RepID=A0A7W7HRA5_9ACTN|nr:hypothetical protein [Actinoplanes lobatus]GGN82352.1 hypothetical protein GCM10010112_59670 [Actinoplanes lobatus]
MTTRIRRSQAVILADGAAPAILTLLPGPVASAETHTPRS